jgi:hypothetical protein
MPPRSAPTPAPSRCRRALLFAAAIGLGSLLSAGCATVRPTRQDCEQYIQRVSEILGGTKSELLSAEDNDESRRALDRLVEGCMKNQSKPAVECAIRAKSQEAYDKCGIRAQSR